MMNDMVCSITERTSGLLEQPLVMVKGDVWTYELPA